MKKAEIISKDAIIDLLNCEMVMATGCTEPAAIALTAAYAGKALADEGAVLESIEVLASINIIKNAMAAGIPGTAYTGIPYAAALGVFGDPNEKLEIFDRISPADQKKAEALVASRRVSVKAAQAPNILYIEVVAKSSGHFARAVIADTHTNLIKLETDQGLLFTSGQPAFQQSTASSIEAASALSVRRILEFAEHEYDPADKRVSIIRQSVEINSAISAEGLAHSYGLGLGRQLNSACEQKRLGHDMATNAMMRTAAGADARMAGAPFPVVTNSGSGNQGITATMPVVSVSQWLNCSEDRMLRAVALSNLTAIYIKSKFGRLSALCGATVAGTGAACGIVYLLGGGEKEIGHAIQNMIGNVTGMLCDGAKADCALKISSCTNAAVQAAVMAMNGIAVSDKDGIVEGDPEQSINNIARISHECSRTIDETVLQIMLSKDR